jgi:hypothetical protein
VRLKYLILMVIGFLLVVAAFILELGHIINSDDALLFTILSVVYLLSCLGCALGEKTND